MDTQLNDGAEYGSLPFDRFAVERWDYSESPERDQDQWNALAQSWLTMTHQERQPFWAVHMPYDSPPAGAGFLPTQEQIARVLAPYQTIDERNKLQYLVSHMHKPLWIRTCYATELQPTWESILAAANGLNGGEVEEGAVVFDSEDLYRDCAEDWKTVFLRLPMLSDRQHYDNQLEWDLQHGGCEGHDDEAYSALHEAGIKEEQSIYVVDEEALRENLIKLIYVDYHGNVIWHNKIAPEHVTWYEAYYAAGGMLSWMKELIGDNRALLQPGAQIEGEDI